MDDANQPATSPLSRQQHFPAKVLTIQSHTVHGYVGNRCAVFPLQLLGFEVEAINSVQFSNHTGYAAFKGEVLQGDMLWSIIEGLELNGLLDGYTHLLTGYIGSESFLRTVLRLVQRLREINPELVYFCDPVLGDHGKLYVPEALVEVYRSEVVPFATVLTPNQFEAELLTGMAIHNHSDAAEACDFLHRKGVTTVVITSFDWGEDIEMFASQIEAGLARKYKIVLPRFKGFAFTGTGDLTAALLLAWTHKHDLPTAMNLAGATVQAVCKRTMLGGKMNSRVPPELRLVQSKVDIEQPPVMYRTLHMGLPIRGLVVTLGTSLIGGSGNAAQLELLEAGRGLRALLGALKAEEPSMHLALVTGVGAEAQVRRFLTEETIDSTSFAPLVVDGSTPLSNVIGPTVVMRICEGWALHPSEVMVVSSSLEMVWLARCSGSRTCLLRSASTDELASNVQLVDVSALHFSEVLAVVQASHAV